MAKPQRRMGSESSATRHALLDAVERLMATKGYAAVSYRALAAEVGVSASSVQYYFATIDDVFLAALRRRAGENIDRLTHALDTSDDPVRTIWDYSKREATGTITAEFLALANHRKSIASEIASITTDVRRVQLRAIQGLRRKTHQLSLDAESLVLVLNGLPKLLQLEQAAGIDQGHHATTLAVEEMLT